MSFLILATVTASACLLLGLGFLGAGAAMLRQWGQDAPPAALLMSRRIGAVYLGLSLMLLLGRAAPPSELRTALCAGFALATALLAGLGSSELLRAARARAS